MPTYIVDWLNLAFRWAHMIVGIGWIGTSFYFIALDLSLRKREKMREGVYGTAWEVHGGGFYHVEKFLVAPKELPPDLLWYQWEAYLTWVTGFGLLILQYYWNANVFLIDSSIQPMLPSQAIFLSVASLAAGWLIYDRLCKSWVGRHTTLLAIAVFVLIVGAGWIFTHLFSGRGALIHVGAFIGTFMAVNVFGVIIPNQKKIVASLMAHEEPDPRLGAIGKQRSVHNNYLTLPVLVMMVSSHYPFLTGNKQAWLLVALIIIVGASVRHFFNRHEAGDPFEKIGWTLPVAAVATAIAVWLTVPRTDPAMANLEVSDAQALAIVGTHCVMCHAAHPTHEGFDAPPKGVILTSVAEIRRHADQIMAQAVNGDTMPLGNETHITAEERRQLGAFLLSR